MVKPGDQVTGTLVIDDLSSWVEITSIIEGGPPVSQNVDVPGEPKPGTDVPAKQVVGNGKKYSRKSELTMSTLDEFFREKLGVDPNTRTTERMADENVWWGYVGAAERGLQLARDLLGGSRVGSRL